MKNKIVQFAQNYKQDKTISKPISTHKIFTQEQMQKNKTNKMQSNLHKMHIDFFTGFRVQVFSCI